MPLTVASVLVQEIVKLTTTSRLAGIVKPGSDEMRTTHNKWKDEIMQMDDGNQSDLMVNECSDVGLGIDESCDVAMFHDVFSLLVKVWLQRWLQFGVSVPYISVRRCEVLW